MLWGEFTGQLASEVFGVPNSIYSTVYNFYKKISGGEHLWQIIYTDGWCLTQK